VDLATAIVGGLGSLALSFGGIIVHGLRSDITSLTTTVSTLDKNVGILLDRDRRQRLEDYERKD
jgi:hypothetical protein